VTGCYYTKVEKSLTNSEEIHHHESGILPSGVSWNSPADEFSIVELAVFVLLFDFLHYGQVFDLLD
jgi:hypothetical protein